MRRGPGRMPRPAATRTTVWATPWAGLRYRLARVAALPVLLALLGVLGVFTVAQSQSPNPRFRATVALDSVGASARLLSDAERAFLAQLPEIRVAVPLPPFRPYEDVSPDRQISGIFPDLLSALARAFDLRVKPVIYPSWAEALKAVESREADLLMTVAPSPERLRYLEFTLGAAPSPQVLFGRRGAPVPPLDRARVAVERGFVAEDMLRRQYPKATLVVEPTTLQALTALSQGRADAYLGNLLNTTDVLAQAGLQNVEAVRPLPYASGHLHFAVRKDWALLAGVLNKGIQALRELPGGSWASAVKDVPAELMPAPLLPLNPAQQQALAQRATWRIGAVRGLALLNDIDEAGRHSGIAAEYMQQVARRLGVAVDVVPFDNVAAMLTALRQGEIDLVPFLTRTPRRAAEFAFSEPYVEMPYMLVTRSDGTLFWGLDSLEGRRLALAAEHPVRDLLARKPYRVEIIDVANGAEAMNLVAQGRADAAVEVKLFANLRINSDNDGALRAATSIDELPASFHFAAARGREALIPLVNLALASIEPAERQRMLRRWVALDLQPGFPWKRWAPVMGVAAAALLTLTLGTIWWVQRLRREVRARRRSEEFLEDIAATVPGVVFRYVLNPDLSVRHTFFSPAATAFFGEQPVPGRPLLESLGPRVRPDHLAKARELNQRCLTSGERFRVTLPYLHPDGHERWFHAEAVQTRSPGGNPVWTGYVVDVSSEHELQLRLAHEAAARNLLLATASHELRAPTNNLSLALQLIHDDPLADEQAQAVRVARRAAATLTQLLNDVLDAARFDAGPLKLRPHAFDLHELLQELVEAWRTAASAKGLSFRTEIAAEVPRSLVQDALRLKQVLTNLLSNANKYTRHGGVSFVVRRQGSELAFTVEDTGQGLDEAEQRRLFTPYVTFGGASGSDGVAPEGSTGLGLVVSRQIAELMGGRIEVHSRRGEGSRFTLHLPLAAAGYGPAADALDDRPPRDPDAPARVLVCDDDATTRLLVVQMLKLRGFDVVDTGDGAEALRLWRQAPMAALITDLDMPGLRGQDLIGAIRAAEATEAGSDRRRTVVVVCSGNPVPAAPSTDPAEQAPTGHDAYLLKPVQIDTLAGTLAQLGVTGKPPSA